MSLLHRGLNSSLLKLLESTWGFKHAGTISSSEAFQLLASPGQTPLLRSSNQGRVSPPFMMFTLLIGYGCVWLIIIVSSPCLSRCSFLQPRRHTAPAPQPTAHTAHSHVPLLNPDLRSRDNETQCQESRLMRPTSWRPSPLAWSPLRQ